MPQVKSTKGHDRHHKASPILDSLPLMTPLPSRPSRQVKSNLVAKLKPNPQCHEAAFLLGFLHFTAYLKDLYAFFKIFGTKMSRNLLLFNKSFLTIFIQKHDLKPRVERRWNIYRNCSKTKENASTLLVYRNWLEGRSLGEVW